MGTEGIRCRGEVEGESMRRNDQNWRVLVRDDVET